MSIINKIQEGANILDFTKESVLIAIPHTGNIRAETVNFLLNCVKSLNVGVYLQEAKPVDNNRNAIVKTFLGTTYKWLFFLDSDIVPPFDTIPKLLSRNKKIIGGVCISRYDNQPFPVMMIWNEKENGYNSIKQEQIKYPLTEVDATGCACLLIHREILEKIKYPFEMERNDDGVITMGEDFHFCRLAKDNGYKIWIDTTIQCSHFQVIDLMYFNQVLGKLYNDKSEVKNG